MPELRFTCALEHGIHARPASVLAEALRPFAARVDLVKERSGKAADARSVLSVVALDVAMNDACVLRAEGEDADDAIEALRGVIEGGVGEAAAADAEAAAVESASLHAARIPAGLQRLGAKWIAGRGISGGFAQGPAFIVRSLAAGADERPRESPAAERAAAHRALHEVRQAIESRLEAAGAALERDLLRAHASIADDPALREQIDEHVRHGASAAAAVRQAGAFFMQALRQSGSAYIRDRAIDVEDVCQQVLERLSGSMVAPPIALPAPSIIVADLLTPRQMMALDRQAVRALALGRVGATSHTAILARAFGIPTLVDVHEAETSFHDGQELIVDADGGFVLTDVSKDVRRYYAIEARTAAALRQRLVPFVGVQAKTRDGARMEIGANVSTHDEVAPAMREGAEAIGLFRTEMLFLDRPTAPTEDEQFAAYSHAVEAANGKPVIIRTFDIGGDKPAPYLRLEGGGGGGREENPFLGCRGIRLYERFPDLLRAQLRALIRASAQERGGRGRLKVMAPMITNVSEAAWFVQRIREVQNELRNEGAAFDEQMPIGIMIEVPSAALAIAQLAQVEGLDFFSIGTNDLSQYFLATDRGNPRVADLCDPLEPAFLRLLHMIVEAARAAKKWIGICGEMASEVRHVPIMVGLGVDEISVAPGRILALKAALADLDSNEGRALLPRLIAARDADEVRSLLDELAAGAGAEASVEGAASAGRAAGAPSGTAMIDPSLVVIGSDAASKVEAIKELVGLVAAARRTDDALALENAVWAREDTYATGLGHGFAIPHCKTEALRTPTIAVLRLAKPIDWGATDGEPVSVAILLAIPAGGVAGRAGAGGAARGAGAAARTHMQVLAKLARQLMHEEFRARILQAETPEQIVAALTSELA